VNAPVYLYSVVVKAAGKPHEQLFKQPVVSRAEIDAVKQVITIFRYQRPRAKASRAV
jgi:hypothetical protein